MIAELATSSSEGKVWARFEDPRLSRLIPEVLGDELDDTIAQDEEPDFSNIGIVIVDDAHADILAAARAQTDAIVQTILISVDASPGRADFVLPLDVDAQVLSSVYTAASEFRSQVVGLRRDVASRQSAVGTINHGQFVLSSLDEARNLATMLALACPNSDLVAIGLQELLINAVEHGNLGITAQEKQELLIDGKWRAEVERRLNSEEYAGRVVLVNFQRGERMISITIQDDGDGFEYDNYVDSDVPTEGYRGRGIAMARDLSFSSLTYLGRGNLVEATILLQND